MVQMVLYVMYRNYKTQEIEDPVKPQELADQHVIDVAKLGTVINTKAEEAKKNMDSPVKCLANQNTEQILVPGN